MGRVFSQHKVLLEAGFSYDQAALILQLSQQRKAGTRAAAAGPAAVDSPQTSDSTTEHAAAASLSAAATPQSDSAPTAGSSSQTPVFQSLEERIAFLELELLKQSLASPLPAAAAGADFPTATTSSSSRPGGSTFSSTAAALNPAGAGAGGLNAAAAAAASRWNADSTLYRQPYSAGVAAAGGLYADDGFPAGAVPGAVSISTQLAAAAELGQLDPEVYTLAEVLAVRQGFALPPPEPLQPQLKLGQQGSRPASIWGRSASGTRPVARAAGVRYARPLSANAWGVLGEPLLYEPGYGVEPLLTPGDLEEDVPYQPSGWAVAGTIVVVYLGVIATFLAMCIGDVPY